MKNNKIKKIMTIQSTYLESFLQITRNDFKLKINEVIKDDKIKEILNGGKHLRPLLGSISFKLCTGGNEPYDQYQRFLEGAICIELAHSASLVHDDIIDGDLYRRGEPSFYRKTSIGYAVLVGHKMLVLGLEITLANGKKFMELYINAWNEALKGQQSEVMFNSKKTSIGNFSNKSKLFGMYSKIIDLKTATLFSASCKVAALWTNASDEVVDLLAKYGREVGLAYQLADDLVDIKNGEMINSVIIPLLSRFEKNFPKNSNLNEKIMRDIIEKNSVQIKKIFIAEIKKHLMNAYKLSHSDILPNNQYKYFLQQLPEYIINKMLKEIKITI